MTSFIAGFIPDKHPAYEEVAIPIGAFSVAAGMTSMALFFYADTLTQKPMMVLKISSCVLGVFASSVFHATEKCAKAAAKDKTDWSKERAAKLRKEIVGAVGFNIAGKMAGAGLCCFKKLISQVCKAGAKDFVRMLFPKG